MKTDLSPSAALGILFAFCVVLGVARSGGVSPSSDTKRLELSFWNGWTGPDGRIALKMIRRFNEQNPDVHVTMQRMEWATYYNKLMVSSVEGHGPEMFIIHASTLPRMFRAGFVSGVNDLYEGKDAIPRSDFDPYVLDQTRFGNQNVGLPLDIHPQGLYCNMEFLRKAGFTRPPQNKAEFLKLVSALKQGSNWGYALTNLQNNYQALLPQFGGRYLDEKGNADLANPNNIAALKFIGDLSINHLVPPPENGLGWVGFRQAKVAMVWDGVYMIGDLQRLNNLDYMGAPIPLIGQRPGTMADSHVMCVRTKLSPRQREGCERFIRFMSANSLEWAAAGQVPARRSVRSQPGFAKLQVQSAFARQIPGMMYPPHTPVLFEVGNEIALAVEKVVRGRATAEEALKLANTNAQRFIDLDREETAGS